jgi:putative selenium metabolism protein SsnA
MIPSLQISNATILTLGDIPRVLEGHSLFIQNGVITEMAPHGSMRVHADKTIDAHGGVVMPGLINAHMHFYSTFARGLGKIAPSTHFTDILKNLWWKLDRVLTTDDCHLSTLIACLNAIRHGTTTLIDHHASPNAVFGSLDAIETGVRLSGLRACLCYEVSDRDGTAVATAGIQENVSFIRRCAEQQDPFLKGLFGLHASFTLSDETLRTARSFASELNTGFHVHVAEAASDQEHCQSHYGMRVVERLNKHGILGPKTIAAHGVHLSEAEMTVLAATETAVVHNPQSNMNNAVGIANILAMHRHGVRVGLGTDAMTVNMFEELRTALWGQHLRQAHPSIGFEEITTMLFRNNPRIARTIWGLPLGEISVGAPADIILIPYHPPTPLTEETQFGHLLFGLSQESVSATIVGGRVLMENGTLCIGVDEAQLAARARERAKDIWSRM